MFRNKILKWIQQMSPGILLACGIGVSSLSAPITGYAAESIGGIEDTGSSVGTSWNDHEYSTGATYNYNTCGFTITIIEPNSAAGGIAYILPLVI